jgi:hypothetical protein
MRMSKCLENLDLPVQILLQLLVQPSEFDRLDSDKGTGDLLHGAVSGGRAIKVMTDATKWERGEAEPRTHLMSASIDLSKAALSYLLVDDELAYSFSGSLWPPR